ncbi:MAG: metalloregulator ArsR/SmtB family transcription factor [bacterium]
MDRSGGGAASGPSGDRHATKRPGPEAAAGETALKQRFRFASGLRFDLLYSLEVLLNPAARIHPEWKRETLERLPPSCREGLAYFRDSARFWVFVGDAIGGAAPPEDMRGLRSLFESIDPERFRFSMLEGALHDGRVADRIARGEITLAQALLEAPAEKREWLEHVELYPPGLNSATLQALERVVASPEEAKARVLRVLDAYWSAAFERTWATLEPQVRRSRAEKERLLQSCTLEEFFRVALLRLEAHDASQQLRAIRGGYALPYERVREAYVVASAFNHHRFWTAFEDGPGVVVFLPYFDAALALDAAAARASEPPAEVDPPLIFKALGDPTRFAMAALIARTPMTSADLAAQLALSRPTISHHVVVLREAGLLREESAGGSFVLHLRREPLAALSDAVLRRFSAAAFGEALPAAPTPSSRRRRGPRA